MLIYRIQHKETQEGPYGSDQSFTDETLYNMGHAHCNAAHPSMWIDCKRPTTIFDHEDYFCGFDTIEKLITWFDEWFTALENNGFVVVVYEISRLYTDTGVYQTIFVREKAELVDSYSISDALAMA